MVAHGWAIGLGLAFHCPATCTLVRLECRYETNAERQNKRRASRQGRLQLEGYQ